MPAARPAGSTSRAVCIDRQTVYAMVCWSSLSTTSEMAAKSHLGTGSRINPASVSVSEVYSVRAEMLFTVPSSYQKSNISL